MLFDLLTKTASRVGYEITRARKVLPTLVRLGISEAEDLYHRFNHWRGACDHGDFQHVPRRKAKKSKKVKTLKPKGRGKNR